MKKFLVLGVLLCAPAAFAQEIYQCRFGDSPAQVLKLKPGSVWLGHMRLMNAFPFDPQDASRGYEKHTDADYHVLTAPTAMVTGQAAGGAISLYREDLKSGLSRTYTYQCSR